MTEITPEELIKKLSIQARHAAMLLANTDNKLRTQILENSAVTIRKNCHDIIMANNKDIALAKEKQLDTPKIERLLLNEARICHIADSIDSIAALPDPLGRILHETTRPNGLSIKRVAVPLGILGVIYESRPNVTADAAALAIKSGNAVILRGGSEAFHSNQILCHAMRQGLENCHMNPDNVQMLPTATRHAVTAMIQAVGDIDVIIPRGGKNLVALIQDKAKVPVFAHLEGICHIFIDKHANHDMACDVVHNAKLRRVSICGACETLLIHRDVADILLPKIAERLIADGCELRGCHETKKILRHIILAQEDDWTTEYLDKILSIKIIDNHDDAIAHINKYGSHHTDSIITDHQPTARKFLHYVDSAIVMHNCSTQFADGGEFGMGAEIGISTGRMHARGPVGLEQLTTYKYHVYGQGQIRPLSS